MMREYRDGRKKQKESRSVDIGSWDIEERIKGCEIAPVQMDYAPLDQLHIPSELIVHR